MTNDPKTGPAPGQMLRDKAHNLREQKSGRNIDAVRDQKLEESAKALDVQADLADGEGLPSGYSSHTGQPGWSARDQFTGRMANNDDDEAEADTVKKEK